MDTNHGISIGGNAQISGSAFAAGPGASASTTNVGGGPDLTELRTVLRQLAELVQAHEASIPDGPVVSATAQAALTEAEKPAPDKNRLLSLLDHVKRAVGGIAGVAGSIASVYAAVQTVL
jgi:hypothetical protein